MEFELRTLYWKEMDRVRGNQNEYTHAHTHVDVYDNIGGASMSKFRNKQMFNIIIISFTKYTISKSLKLVVISR